MSEILVHPRVVRRHPDLSLGDVVAAIRATFRYKQRDSGEWIAVGLDGNNRLVEMVYLYDVSEDTFFVYHAMVPPSRKTLLELGLERG